MTSRTHAQSDGESHHQASVINKNPALQTYYSSLESRLGYKLILGDTRHFGYWEEDTIWPFPVTASLIRMEDQLERILGLPKGSTLLDAGCGAGRVAVRMAGRGYRVHGIDVIARHLEKARRHVAETEAAAAAAAATADRRGDETNGQGRVLDVRLMDYHHLETIENNSLDGIYTMETFVHATDPQAVLDGFHRVLRPGGRVALFEYDHTLMTKGEETSAAPRAGSKQRATPSSSSCSSSAAAEAEAQRSMKVINKFAAMPTNDLSQPGVFEDMLRRAGFEDVQVCDLSRNIRPMTRLFFLLAYIPYLFVKLFGLERWFINTVAGVESYRGAQYWRYVAVSATKPDVSGRART